MRLTVLSLLTLMTCTAALAQSIDLPKAVYTDPPRDAAQPARMEVLHIPSGTVRINGVAYLAAGAGTHPTLVICHGLPGNEKNLDLAQAVRRAGWNAITFNYRGSWGSPGRYRFGQNPEDARAVLAFLRDPANAARLGIDTQQLAIIGHSMGGWVAAQVGGQDGAMRGVGLISAANVGNIGSQKRADVVKRMAGNREALAGVTPESMADELIAHQRDFDFLQQARGLSGKSILILSSDDGLAPGTDALAAAIRASGGTSVVTQHVATDHSWSDNRITLQAQVIRWLQSLSAGAP